MNGHVRRGAVRSLLVMVAMLLPAGTLAVHYASPEVGDGQVATAGLAQNALADDPTTSISTVVTVARPTPSTLPPPSTTATTRPRTTTTSTARPTPTLPAGVPLPASPPATGIPNIAPASSWSNERDGVTARLRIEPATPVAGQPVRFLVDVASAEACCTILLDFGDGTTGFSANNGVPCGSLTPGAKSATTSHAYPSAGAYKATLTVMTGFACLPPLLPGEAPSLPVFHGVDLSACIGVGPGTAGEGGCSPFPPFGPDSIISPVLDPFCQIRSDCTKASPPR